MVLTRKAQWYISIILMSICLIQSFTVSAGPSLNTNVQAAKDVYSSLSSPSAVPTPYPTGYFDMECHIKPDFNSLESVTYQDFQIELSYRKAVRYKGKTDDTGFYKFYAIGTLPWDITISKAGFLTRTINGSMSSYTGTAEAPIIMWAGDMNQDNAINITDIMQIVGSFNSSLGDDRYNAVADFNADKAVNISDIAIVCQHFNKTSDDYTYGDKAENVSISVNVIGNDDFNITGGGKLSISPASNEGIKEIGNSHFGIRGDLTFPKGTEVTFTVSL